MLVFEYWEVKYDQSLVLQLTNQSVIVGVGADPEPYNTIRYGNAKGSVA